MLGEPNNEDIERNGDLDAVEMFVTKIWEHPLLNEVTIKHRQRGIEQMNEVFKRNRDGGSFALLTGSSIWVANEESDWDFLLYHKDPTVVLKTTERDSKIQLIPKTPTVRSWVVYDRYFDLLVTPDEYIAGNIQTARQVRRLIVNKLVLEAHDDKNLSEMTKRRFDSYFADKIRGWYSVPSEFGPDKIGDRLERVEKNLSKRATLVRMPTEKYVEAFNKALDKMEPPEFDVYWKALELRGGELHLKKGYKADNLFTLNGAKETQV